MPKNFLDYSEDSQRINSANQPVRFYKVIALSFLLVTILLLGVIVFMSSKRASILINVKSEPIESNFSVKVGSQGDVKIDGIVTSTVLSLSKKFQTKGDKEIIGVASGKVKIFNDSSNNQILIPKTRFLTPDGILFRIKERIEVPAKGSLEVEVYADKEGKESEISSSTFSIPGLNVELQKLIYAKSEEPMVGGATKVGVVEENDIKDAEKILGEEAKEKIKAQMAEKYSNYVGLFNVSESKFVSDKELGVETSEFTLSGDVKIDVVLYDQEKLNTYANDVLKKQVVENNEELKSIEETPAVTLGDYDLENGIANLNIVHIGRVSLDPNSKELQKAMFFGKTEDEVRKYVMSLNHVKSVSMEFRPIWNRTVPSTSDHVEITIREE